MKRTVLLKPLAFTASVMLTFGSFSVNASENGHLFRYSNWAVYELSDARGYGLIPDDIYFTDYTRPVTRAEFCKIVMNIYNKINGTYEAKTVNPFKDVNDYNILCAYELNMVSGIGENEFNPDRYITRQEAVKIMTGLLNTGVKTTDISGLDEYVDNGEIAGWAREYVSFMSDSGYIKGTGDDIFEPEKNVSIEEAVILGLRLFEKNAYVLDKNVISTSGDIYTSVKDIQILWESNFSGEHEIYLYNDGDKIWEAVSDTKSVVIPEDVLKKKTEYYVIIKSPKGSYSKPQLLYTGEKNVIIRDIENIKYAQTEVSWIGVSEAVDYEVTVIESRNTKSNIAAPKENVFKTNGGKSFVMEINSPRRYEIKIQALDENGLPLKYSAKTVLENKGYEKNDASLFWGESPITNSEEAAAQMVAIKVPVWKVGKTGEKISSTASLTVNYRIADKVSAVFEEIYNGEEKFPVKSVGAYAWRAPMANGRLSEHNYGTAIDINPDENYCLYNDGSVIGKYWEPYTDRYSITPYGDVVKAFEKHGFTWGGDGWNNPKDYMHFSYLGT